MKARIRAFLYMHLSIYAYCTHRPDNNECWLMRERTGLIDGTGIHTPRQGRGLVIVCASSPFSPPFAGGVNK